MQRLRDIALIVIFASCYGCAFAMAQTKSPTLCIAPNGGATPERCAPDLCDGGALSLRIDDRPRMEWPKDRSVAVTDLDSNIQHRVVVYRAGKAQQSFKFRFSEFESDNLCLFLNDLYWTAQLWESKRSPWCKC
jgi:hypothetical protein